MSHQQIAAALAEARMTGVKLAGYPGDKPATLSDAFAVQEAMVAATGCAVVGWKVGLTSKKAQEICGYGAPLAGPVLSGFLYDSGVELPMLKGDLGVLEPEIGVRMQSGLPPRDRPYTHDEVAGAIGAVLPTIEWVNKRLPGGLFEAAEWLVADGVVNRCLVCGDALPFDPAMDLSGAVVRAEVDGKQVTDGIGSNAMGGPLAVMTWLANDLNTRGRGLKAGDVISTGLVCDVVQAAPGARVSVTVDGIGTVTLSVTE